MKTLQTKLFWINFKYFILENPFLTGKYGASLLPVYPWSKTRPSESLCHPAEALYMFTSRLLEEPNIEHLERLTMYDESNESNFIKSRHFAIPN